MKKIVTACFDMVIDFDTDEELQRYLKNLHVSYIILSHGMTPEGKNRVHLLKQYNNNVLPQRKGIEN